MQFDVYNSRTWLVRSSRQRRTKIS